ncbi:MAG: hypothetical protein QXF63_02285, partial [Sulfolobales archaeon]
AATPMTPLELTVVKTDRQSKIDEIKAATLLSPSSTNLPNKMLEATKTILHNELANPSVSGSAPRYIAKYRNNHVSVSDRKARYTDDAASHTRDPIELLSFISNLS